MATSLVKKKTPDLIHRLFSTNYLTALGRPPHHQPFNPTRLSSPPPARRREIPPLRASPPRHPRPLDAASPTSLRVHRRAAAAAAWGRFRGTRPEN
uniref:Uncharacterized protein n=1 Tax=Oryza punctata TaxID=4537 RepID=A0A0E0K6G1_ORYPU